eukprot:scaffold1835_cov272-Chaetoceros_neogracile.AAC.5
MADFQQRHPVRSPVGAYKTLTSPVANKVMRPDGRSSGAAWAPHAIACSLISPQEPPSACTGSRYYYDNKVADINLLMEL